MSIFGFNEVAAVAAWTALVIYDPSGGAARALKQPKAVASNPSIVRRVTRVVSMWHLPAQWLITMPALIVAAFYFTQTSVPDSWQFITGTVLLIFHILLDKVWRILYHWTPFRGATILVAVGMLLSAVGIFVAMCVNQVNSLFWVAPMALAIWALDVVYRLRLSFQMHRGDRKHRFRFWNWLMGGGGGGSGGSHHDDDEHHGSKRGHHGKHSKTQWSTDDRKLLTPYDLMY